MREFNGYKIRLMFTVVVLIGFLTACCNNLSARPTTAQEATDLVVGWLTADSEPLGTSLGQQVKRIETFTNENNDPIYYIVYLQPSGFIIVSADDLVEPIIGFVNGNSFDPSLENPLGALVTNDLNGRIAAVRNSLRLQTVNSHLSTSKSQRKWRHFVDLANTHKDTNAITLMSVGVDLISDVRVAPLVKSKWGQLTISNIENGYKVGEYCPLPCYNYYTPNNYPCGCPATALAQLMRWHEYPTTGIGVHEFTIRVSGSNRRVSTRGGDGSGGPYNWDSMPYEPNCDSTEEQRQAIGTLCYDAGVSMNQNYSRNASGWGGCTNTRMINALKTTFMYANAVHGYSGESSPIGEGLAGMINPNLDAKKPVILGSRIHAFICDGYGYNDSTLYHHLNMGWLGLDDLWYDLHTSIVSPVDGFVTGTVCSCVYNVQTTQAGDGEIISGRVLDHNAEPIANVVLSATSGSEIIAATETDDKGIYAFDCLESNTTYTIDAMLNGYGFSSQEVTTGISQDDSVISGNLWGVDLVGLFCDFNSDQRVDDEDLAMLIEHWGQDAPNFDIAPAPSGDGIVDIQDQEVLLQYLGIEVEIPEFGIVAHWPLDETEGIIAYDSVGEYDSTLNGEPLWQPAGGQVDGAILLDGNDDYISTPFVLNTEEEKFSIFAWIKGGAPGQVIISQADGEDWLLANASEGKLMTKLKRPGRAGVPLVSQTVITDGAWHRVGVVWDGSSRTLYVDDVEVATDIHGTLEGAYDGLYIGAGKALETGTHWSGLIDDVRIYNSAITP